MARTELPIENLDNRPDMTRWFSPVLLTKIGWRVVVSALFGRFADQRIVQAALDTATPENLIKRHDLTEKIEPDEDGAVWVDYTADVGDGFDSTYAVAYLLAQDELTIGCKDLPRGSLLILGGDQVYPTATRDAYWERMRIPYLLAYPDDTRSRSHHPEMFVIPGNHDWYDGLESFFGTFCRFLDRPPYHGGLSIGNWRCKQMRSYFAIRLPHDWWIWGVDIQLTEYIDDPQIHYFRLIAESLADNAKVILCTAQPSWLRAEDVGQEAFNSLKYVVSQVLKEKTGKVCALIAGDIHNYNRYVFNDDEDCHLITAGGGGAFLHPTHTLKDTITVEWTVENKGKMVDKLCDCTLAHDPAQHGSEEEACYPSRDKSKRLLWGNWLFIGRNPWFAVTLGIVYALFSWMLLLCDNGEFFKKLLGEGKEVPDSLSGWSAAFLIASSHSPYLPIGILAIIGALILYADARGRQKAVVGIAHAIAHIAAIGALYIGVTHFTRSVLALAANHYLSGLVTFIEMVFAGALTGGIIWSIYLIVVCRWLGLHTNDAFSAMRIEGYKNFLRLKLTPDELTIYPIGIEKVPDRKEWQPNPQPRSDKGLSQFLPPDWFKPHLIEGPIRISASKDEEKK